MRLRLCGGLSFYFAGWLAMAQAPVPVVSANATGPRQVVFDGQNGCEKGSNPDAPARAFRDAKDAVHLIASNVTAHAMTGPDLDHLKSDCRVVYRSPQQPSQATYQESNWLYSFYGTDGHRIVALVQSELSGTQIPAVCDSGPAAGACRWDTITSALSTDGGVTFSTPAAPHNLVAAAPWRVSPGGPRAGFRAPTNILKVGASYYVLINALPFKTQKAGACLIRTSDLSDSLSWRGWDGKEFIVKFADPYHEAVPKPQEHVCQPVLDGPATSLVQIPKRGVFLVTIYSARGLDGPPGFYIQASRDLMHWSKPSLVMKLSDAQAADGSGRWSYDYPSLLDPASYDRNFSTVSESPYLYYVRLGGSSRALVRRQIKLTFGD